MENHQHDEDLPQVDFTSGPSFGAEGCILETNSVDLKSAETLMLKSDFRTGSVSRSQS